jgi:hypothetical protein
MRAAENALRRGRIADARDLLRAVVTSDASERMRRDAERLLERLSAQ